MSTPDPLAIASENLNRIRLVRSIAKALAGGKSTTEVAAEQGVDERLVERTARRIAAGFDPYRVTPTEIICLHAVGEISETAMMDLLLAIEYTAGTHDPTGGDGYLAGTWDEIVSSARLLTDSQYERLRSEARVDARDDTAHLLREPSNARRLVESLSQARRGQHRDFDEFVEAELGLAIGDDGTVRPIRDDEEK